MLDLSKQPVTMTASSHARWGRQWLTLIMSIGVSACAVGPNFKTPNAPYVTGYTSEPFPVTTAEADIKGGAAQRLTEGMDIPTQWWEVFHSPALNELIDSAIKHNPDLQAAQAALRQAQENVYAQRGSYYPSAQATYDITRQKDATGTLSPVLNGDAPSSIYNLHTAQLSVSYMLDVFGLNRRQVEALQATADYQRFQLEAAYLTLTSNIVAAAIQEASLREQLAATHIMIDGEQAALDILHKQYELGSIAWSDVTAQEAALAAVQATLPMLEKQLAQQRNLIAVLTGRFPSETLSQTFELDALELPQELPVSLPSKLVRQRPDIRAAEAQLHAATAQVGVAIADMLPQITLSAGAGGVTTQFGQLFKDGNTFWSAGANLSQLLFSGGTLVHKKRAAEAAVDQAGAQYRSTVLTAFKNVADTLYALESDAELLKAQQRAATAANANLDVAQKNLQLGLISNLVMLNAEQTYEQALINLSQARAQRYADTAALFQSLGGGWWNRPESDSH